MEHLKIFFVKDREWKQPWLLTLTAELLTKAAKLTPNTWSHIQPDKWIRRATLLIYKPRHVSFQTNTICKDLKKTISKAIYIQLLTLRKDSSRVVQCGSSNKSTNSRGGLNISRDDNNNDSDKDMPVPCHNHTSSLLTTSQTRSLVPSAGEMMQLSSPPGIFFPTRKLGVVFPTGLWRVTTVLAALK